MEQEGKNVALLLSDNSVWVTLVKTQWEPFISQCNTECKMYNGQLLVPMKEYLHVQYNIIIHEIKTQNDGSFIVLVKEISRETIEFIENMMSCSLSHISTERIIECDNFGYEPIETLMVFLEFK